ncbi:hypothetical protein [Umezawaea sp.]|uniref:hypothetical protein n=1 Tax=Umezawaea sp. TaxID=1955258 RepID=UPI002ED5EEE6
MHRLTPVAARSTAVVTVGLALTTAGCGASRSAGGPATNPTPSPVATSATPTTRELTPQGFIAKDVGQVAGFDCANDLDTCAITFSVDKIEVNPQCHQYGAPHAAGRKTLLLHVSMTTGDLSEEGARSAPSIFNPFSLNGIADDGSVQEARPGTCTDREERLSDTILPHSRYSGTVEVQVAEAATAVASTYPVASNGSRGWVWRIG